MFSGAIKTKMQTLSHFPLFFRFFIVRKNIFLTSITDIKKLSASKYSIGWSASVFFSLLPDGKLPLIFVAIKINPRM